MGRRSKHAGDGAPAGATPAARTSAEPAAKQRRSRVPRKSASLEGWPPSVYCFACHRRSYSAQELRDNNCEGCLQILAELERAYNLSRQAMAFPEA